MLTSVFVAALLVGDGASVFTSEVCGIRMSIPDAWTAEVSEGSDGEMRSCAIDLRPLEWTEAIRRSRWEAPDAPLTVIVYPAGTSVETALADVHFVWAEVELIGEEPHYGVWGEKGLLAPAYDVSFGRWSGKAADPFFRRYIRDASLKVNGESGVYSGNKWRLVAASSEDERVIAMLCEQGTPDEVIDCAPARDLILETLEVLEPAHGVLSP